MYPIQSLLDKVIKGGNSLPKTPEWKALSSHFEEIKGLHMKDLFVSDKNRFEKFHLVFEDLLFDFSKNRITEQTLSLLIKLAESSGVNEAIEAMFSGEKINWTENRAALHVALRNRSNSPIYVDGRDVMPEVNSVLVNMKTFSEKVRSGAWKGFTGKAIRTVINIGIGGSDLGPFMITEALKHYSKNAPAVRFISNVDGTDFYEKTKDL
ncbi:glucose-6-phosphate isomerase, partial [bacterium]|nr:glucose-6-phosphate isomerase [bacterium]